MTNSRSDGLGRELPIDVGVCCDRGAREDQQDAVFYSVSDDVTVIILCDGMGGMQFGAAAANAAVETMKHQMAIKPDFRSDVPSFFAQAIPVLDASILNLADNYPDSCKAGTTIVCAVIVRGELFWLSIGDSRLYILRDKEMVCATRDHNYLFTLDYLLKEGRIERAFYEEEKQKKGDALTSYLGMGGIGFYDISQSGFALREGDVILVTTDGLYKALSDEEICVILQTQADAQSTADKILSAVCAKQIAGQDNTSFVVVKMSKEMLDSCQK